MTPEEQNLINGLFDRLRQADSGTKDPAAEELIRSRTSQLPSAPYLLSQAVLVQEHALANAQARISELERQVAAARPAGQQQGGGFLASVSHLFGGKPAEQQTQAVPPPVPTQAQQPGRQAPPIVPQAPPYPSTVGLQPSSGGGFLKGALATAAGVAGGSLLFQGIENLIGHNAGPFSPAMGERGFMDQGAAGPTEIIENNYYGNDPSGTTADAGVDRDADLQTTDDVQDASYDPNTDQGFDDSGFDDGGDAFGGGDDSNPV
jgi:uncharacterized protein